MLTTLDVDDAFELALGESVEDFAFVADQIEGRGRWSIHHLIVFEHGDLYGFNYEEPATEYQEDAERFETDPVPVFLVEAREIITTEYRKRNQ